MNAFFSQFPDILNGQPGRRSVIDLEDNAPLVSAATPRPGPIWTVRSASSLGGAACAASSSGPRSGFGGTGGPANAVPAEALVRPGSAASGGPRPCGGEPSGREAGARGAGGGGAGAAQRSCGGGGAGQRSSGGPAFLEQRCEGGRLKKRKRQYSDALRAAASPFLAKAMEAADFNSNITGGSVAWKKIMQEARALASPEQRAQLGEVLQVFKSNTAAIHGYKLDDLIKEWS